MVVGKRVVAETGNVVGMRTVVVGGVVVGAVVVPVDSPGVDKPAGGEIVVDETEFDETRVDDADVDEALGMVEEPNGKELDGPFGPPLDPVLDPAFADDEIVVDGFGPEVEAAEEGRPDRSTVGAGTAAASLTLRRCTLTDRTPQRRSTAARKALRSCSESTAPISVTSRPSTLT